MKNNNKMSFETLLIGLIFVELPKYLVVYFIYLIFFK